MATMLHHIQQFFEWARQCKDGQLNIEDNPRCARPIIAINNETIKDVETLIIEDR